MNRTCSEIGDRYRESTAINALGNVYRNLGQHQQAIVHSEQSITIAQEIGDRLGESIALHNLGLALFQAGRFSEAEYQLSKALMILDALRNPALTPAERISLFENQLKTYQILQQTLVAQNKIGQALEISEQGRARVLAEQIVSGNLDASFNTILNTDQMTASIFRGVTSFWITQT